MFLGVGRSCGHWARSRRQNHCRDCCASDARCRGIFCGAFAPRMPVSAGRIPGNSAFSTGIRGANAPQKNDGSICSHPDATPPPRETRRCVTFTGLGHGADHNYVDGDADGAARGGDVHRRGAVAGRGRGRTESLRRKPRGFASMPRPSQTRELTRRWWSNNSVMGGTNGFRSRRPTIRSRPPCRS